MKTLLTELLMNIGSISVEELSEKIIDLFKSNHWIELEKDQYSIEDKLKDLENELQWVLDSFQGN